MSRGRFIFVIFVFMFQILAIIATFAYPYKARLFPSLALSLGLVLSAVQIVRDIRLLKKEGAPEAGEETTTISREHFVIGAWLTGSALMLWVIGFVGTCVAFPFIYLKYYKESWALSIIFPALCGIFFYYFFGQFLETPLYPGVLYLSIFG